MHQLLSINSLIFIFPPVVCSEFCFCSYPYRHHIISMPPCQHLWNQSLQIVLRAKRLAQLWETRLLVLGFKFPIQPFRHTTFELRPDVHSFKRPIATSAIYATPGATPDPMAKQRAINHVQTPATPRTFPLASVFSHPSVPFHCV